MRIDVILCASFRARQATGEERGRAARSRAPGAALFQVLPPPLVRLPISPRRRRLNDHRLVRVDHRRISPLEALHPPALAPHPVLADLPGIPAGKAERPHPAMAGEDGAFHLLQEPDGAADAVAGVPLAVAPRAGAN